MEDETKISIINYLNELVRIKSEILKENVKFGEKSGFPYCQKFDNNAISRIRTLIGVLESELPEIY